MHEQPAVIVMEPLYDPERQVLERAAGPWGVTVYAADDPESGWRFSLFGFPDQAEAIKAAGGEIARRRRAAGIR